MRRIYVEEQTDRTWRDLAARFNLFISRGLGAGELGNTHALMTILAAAAADDPDALADALAPFVQRYRVELDT